MKKAIVNGEWHLVAGAMARQNTSAFVFISRNGEIEVGHNYPNRDTEWDVSAGRYAPEMPDGQDFDAQVLEQLADILRLSYAADDEALDDKFQDDVNIELDKDQLFCYSSACYTAASTDFLLEKFDGNDSALVCELTPDEDDNTRYVVITKDEQANGMKVLVLDAWGYIEEDIEAIIPGISAIVEITRGDADQVQQIMNFLTVELQEMGWLVLPEDLAIV